MTSDSYSLSFSAEQQVAIVCSGFVAHVSDLGDLSLSCSDDCTFFPGISSFLFLFSSWRSTETTTVLEWLVIVLKLLMSLLHSIVNCLENCALSFDILPSKTKQQRIRSSNYTSRWHSDVFDWLNNVNQKKKQILLFLCWNHVLCCHQNEITDSDFDMTNLLDLLQIWASEMRSWITCKRIFHLDFLVHPF